MVVSAVLLVAVTAFITFFATLYFAFPRPSDPVDGAAVQARMEEVQSYLDAYYIDEYDPDVLAEAAADGAAAAMVTATGDLWSYYLSRDEMQEYIQSQTNSYVGIGITITEETAGLRVVSVTKGGPAEIAGILPGDILIAVGDKDVHQIGKDGAADLIRGEEGTLVTVTVLRQEQELEFTLARAMIVEDVATCTMLEDGIGLVSIADFGQHCAEQTLDCIDELQARDAEAIIFDVRFNPGGYKTELVEILDTLLPEGPIFRSMDYAGKEEIDTSDAAYLDLPMAVLVNDASYSAAEFFAAALQEYEAAAIVGTQTFGKGNFQSLFELSGGAGLNLSIGKYYTPQGKSLTGIGITPDEVVELSAADYNNLYYGALSHEEDTQLQTALELMRQKIS